MLKLDLKSIPLIPGRLLDIVMPPICQMCRTVTSSTSGGEICPPCLEDIEPTAKVSSCNICAAPLVQVSEATGSRPCGTCIVTPPPFERAMPSLAYGKLLRKAIHRFKYNGETGLAKLLGALMITCASSSIKDLSESTLDNIDVVIPIPLHRNRLRERGFNQSLLLAKVAARAVSAPLDYKSLRRVRDTTPQIELRGKERAENVRGAFETESRVLLKDKTVLLVDDVYTTGSTIRECARILKKEGARVVALTLARAL